MRPNADVHTPFDAPLTRHYIERLKVSNNWLEKAMIMALIELCQYQHDVKSN
ncbi:hypothetical protein KP803_12820 [Vibrio sp. ZSDE26]|uniref:Uncharacterized protein n=1 Tax=Vibrio amylolyticus TaxID=2847292 RepID=A0A9X2BII3_9VIBR|nr:hypothetical protein [Vibrio amylolyticus]MCK6264155.1 hypothetical protein [Vibrio amylolyticus]